jgi:hypothetical protein
VARVFQSLTISHLIAVPNSQTQPPIEIMTATRIANLRINRAILLYEPQSVLAYSPRTTLDSLRGQSGCVSAKDQIDPVDPYLPGCEALQAFREARCNAGI